MSSLSWVALHAIWSNHLVLDSPISVDLKYLVRTLWMCFGKWGLEGKTLGATRYIMVAMFLLEVST